MQMNLFFCTVNLYFSVGQGIKSAKQLKCTLNNMAVSWKHVHLTGVSQHGLINSQTIESNVHMIRVTGIQLEEGWTV